MRADAMAPKSRRKAVRPLAMLVPYVCRRPVQLAGAILSVLVAALATLAIPLALRRVIDHGFSGGDPATINAYFLALIGVVAVLAAASAFRFYFVTWLGERVAADLRTDLFAHLTRLGIDFFDRSQSGELVSRLSADTTQVKAAAGASLSVAARNLVLGVGAVTMMVVSSPSLSALVVAAIPLVVLPLIFFGRAVRGRSRRAQDLLAGATAYAAEAVEAIRTVQAYTLEASAAGRFRRSIEAAFAAARASTAARAALTAVGIFLVFASMVAVLWYGASDVLAGRMTPGTLGQFLFYAVLAAGALGELSQNWGELAQAAGAAERIAELLAEEPSITAPAAPEILPRPARGGIAFEEVGFAYAGARGQPVLKEVSLAVEPGTRIAIVGPSGAGKSTLFSLLLRFYDPTAGRIRFDGVEISRVDPMELRRRIAVVPQETAIFAASVAENIRVGDPGATDEAVRRAAVLAHADGFIATLPQGYATEVGERGVTLSGGERQRIAIARAILKDAPVLLLDEATSALDAESERLVQAALDRLMEGRTTLVIAHRLATVQKANRIVVIDGGRIVETGTHETLSTAGGLYARLARLQFGDKLPSLEVLQGGRASRV